MTTTTHKPLHALYQEYLLANLTPGAAAQMAEGLRRAGLTDPAAALDVYIDQGFGASYVMPDGAWQGRTCVVADVEPEQAEPGTLWFDLTELTHMVFISTGARFKPAVWLAVHPVYGWQWKVFLKLVAWKAMMSDIPTNLMSPLRFVGVDDMAFVTQMYHEEAAAYAAWLKKLLASTIELGEARAFFSPAIFARLQLDNLWIWDGQSPLEQHLDFYREAAGADTLDYDSRTRELQIIDGELASAKDIPDPVRTLFDVWETSARIGCMTAITPAFKGRMKRIKGPMSAYYYALTVTGFAPRPSLDFPTYGNKDKAEGNSK